MLIDKKIKVRMELYVSNDDDSNVTWISGCTVIPNGHVVLCDQNNKLIKVMDDSWTVTGQMKIQEPWDVSAIDSSNVIVSLPGMKQLQTVQVFPKMKAGSIIQLDRECYGVAVSDGVVYTTCFDFGGQGEVRVIDMHGNLIKRLGTNQDGSYLFNRPEYITVSNTSQKIFVSDSDSRTNTITCLTPSDRVIYTYKDGDMRCPSGLICDSEDNVLVCGRSSNNFHTISPDGSKYHTHLALKDDQRHPTSIVYKESGDTLIVSCFDSNKLLLFKLA